MQVLHATRSGVRAATAATQSTSAVEGLVEEGARVQLGVRVLGRRGDPEQAGRGRGPRARVQPQRSEVGDQCRPAGPGAAATPPSIRSSSRAIGHSETLA